MPNGSELPLKEQINYVDGFLMFDQTTNQCLNPFIGISNEAILLSIRKSLVDYKELMERNGKTN